MERKVVKTKEGMLSLAHDAMREAKGDKFAAYEIMMDKKSFWSSLNPEQQDYVRTCTFIQEAINTFQAELEKQPEGGVIPFIPKRVKGYGK